MVNLSVFKNHSNISVDIKSGVISATDHPSNFLLRSSKEEVLSYSRSKSDLIIEFRDGKKLSLKGFFLHGADFHNLVFVNEHGQWLVHFDQALSGQGDGIHDRDLQYEKLTDKDSTKVLLGLLGGVGIAGTGIGAVASGGDAGQSQDNRQPKPGKPVAPTLDEALDATGSLTGPIHPGDVTDEVRPKLSGKGEAGSTITIYDGDTVLGTTVTDADGNWSFTPGDALRDGAHSLSVMVTDKAGNTSGHSDLLTFAVKTIMLPKLSAPEIYDNTGDVIGPIHSGDVTDEARPRFSGKVEPASEIVIRDGERIIGMTVANKDGDWSFRPVRPLGDGAHSLTVSMKDVAGHEIKSSDPVDFTVDTTSPFKFSFDKTSGMTGSAAASGGSGDIAAESQEGLHTATNIAHDTAQNADTGAASVTGDRDAFSSRLQAAGSGTINLDHVTGVDDAGGHDIFPQGAGDNVFNVHGGGNVYDLPGSVHNRLLFEALDLNNAAGSNRHDTVNYFVASDFNGGGDSDRIDLSSLLIGYQPSTDGPAHYIDGVATIHDGDNIGDFLSVKHEGNNTVLYIDRDGAGQTFEAAPLVTLKDVHVDLATLLANHQIVV